MRERWREAGEGDKRRRNMLSVRFEVRVLYYSLPVGREKTLPSCRMRREDIYRLRDCVVSSEDASMIASGDKNCRHEERYIQA